MKNIILLILAIIFLMVIVIGGISVISGTPLLKASALLLLPLLIDIFFVRSLWFLAASMPIEYQRLTRIAASHLISLFLFVLFQLIFLYANSGLLSIITDFENWEPLADRIAVYLSIFGVVTYIIATLVNYLIIHVQDNFEKERKIIQRELQVKKSELNVLKSVIQPHFLFNAFNTLTALIEMEHSKAGEFCRGLSDFLRYSLKYSQKELVSIQEELDNLENYLKIEKIRMGKRLNIQYDIQAETVDSMVVPFSIITFVENAIKHGISNYIDGGTLSVSSAFVKDVNQQGDEYLEICVKNPRKPDDCEHKSGEGLGISTLKKRLYIVFRNRAMIQMYEEGDLYISKLTIGGE